MSDRIVYPAELAPAGFMPGADPDPMAAFAPADAEPAGAPPAPASPVAGPAGPAGPENLFPIQPSEADPVPEPAPPPRPQVRYRGAAGSRVYRLAHPLDIGGAPVRTVTVSPPCLWDVQDFAAGRIKTNVEMVSRMTGMDPVAFGALRWPDVEAILEIAIPMLPDAIRAAIEAQGAE